MVEIKERWQTKAGRQSDPVDGYGQFANSLMLLITWRCTRNAAAYRRFNKVIALTLKVECYIYNKIVTKPIALIHIEYLFNDIINHLFLWAGNFF